MALKQKVINYSLKNCPTPSTDTYMKSLIDKTESFIRRLRWKTIFFKKAVEEKRKKQKQQPNDGIAADDSIEESQPDNTHFGFNSPRAPPEVEELKGFEHDLWNLVDSVEFSDIKSKFQKEIQKDVKNICKSKKMLVPADKTSNLYEVDPSKYETLLRNNITSHYKHADANMEAEVNLEARKLAEALDIADRVEVMSKSNAFITLKDHKPNFQSDTKCRLINPAKSEMGKVSSQMLKEINENVRLATGLKQWRSTQDSLSWFKSIEGKSEYEFVQLDIIDFYPSITKNY